MRSPILLLAFLLLLGTAAGAAGQPAEPVGPYVLDARGTLARFKGAPTIAEAVGAEADGLPTRGLGIAAGAHVYPMRIGRVTLGLGGEMALARGSRAPAATAGGLQGPTITTRFSVLSPHVSLNFGHRDGWSYLSGGIGTASLTTERQDLPFAEQAGRTRALHYGGGARWFNTPHLAFTFDVRFYTIAAQDVTGGRPPYPRMRFMAISVGASFR